MKIVIMTINLKNFLSDKSKLSKMGEFQDLKPLDGLEVSSISADLYDNGRDDLALFYFKEGANYATLSTTNSIVSETIIWNEKSNKKGNLLSINQQISNKFFDEKNAVDLVLKSGQISIHNGLLMHASNANNSKRRRCGLTVRFVPSHVNQVELNSNKAQWNPLIISGNSSNSFGSDDGKSFIE